MLPRTQEKYMYNTCTCVYLQACEDSFLFRAVPANAWSFLLGFAAALLNASCR